MLRSKEPVVLGVFAVEPKDANAPDPRPNAEEAPAEGEETFVDRGEIALKGLERPWELSGPKRFEEWPRGESDLAELSLLSGPVMDKESLVELQPS